MAKSNSEYYRCEKCNFETSRWLGRCPNCGAWNSLLSLNISEKTTKIGKDDLAKSLNKLNFAADEQRYRTGIAEFDCVLGGGIVPGSLILIGGEPGIGKSTLALQIAQQLVDIVGKVLYVSAEESLRQIYLRANRLSVSSEHIYLLSESNLEKIVSQILEIKPKIAIIDSIQIINDSNISSNPGSVAQVKSCTSRLMEIAKKENIALIIVGHVTKDGGIAGPKTLEHIVDTVLYLEGERFQSYRLLRSMKNRFGTTNELGIFQMENDGLKEVKNPSKILLSPREQSIPGTVTTISFEGSRPLAVEIEALTSTSYLNYPRRLTTGVDYNRVSLIIAVLENKIKIQLQNKDVYINTAGGIKISEPAIDLGIAVSIISSIKNFAIPLDTVVFGELGLTGEVRSVGLCERRLKEAQNIGFKRCIIPYDNGQKISNKFEHLEIKSIKDIKDIIALLSK